MSGETDETIETKHSKTDPVPLDAQWANESDRMFYEASLVNGDEIMYHVLMDGYYYLGAPVSPEPEDAPPEQAS